MTPAESAAPEGPGRELAQNAGEDQGRALLRCLHVGGEARYDLPAVRMGRNFGYEIYWRGAPAEVIHHGRGDRIVLPCAEFVLVGVGLRHCVSVSVDQAGLASGVYVNINLEPTPHASGWSWQDLELDVKLALCHQDRWVPIILDFEEFLAANLSDALRDIAIREVGTVLKLVEARKFPFSLPRLPWLGLYRESDPYV